MARNTKVIIGVVAVVVVLAGAGLAAVFLVGGDGPEELSFDDATSTTGADGDGGSTTTVAAADVPVTLDGPWVATTGSQAGYRVLEDRLGGAANIEAVGRTDQVTGAFTVAGTTVSDVTFTVDVASITSDSGQRDGRFRSSIMNAEEFPTASFVGDPITLDAVPADGEVATVPASGRLTLRGVTQDVSVTVEVKRAGSQVQVLGAIPVVFADYGIETPSPPGLSVRDNGVVEFLIVAEPRA